MRLPGEQQRLPDRFSKPGEKPPSQTNNSHEVHPLARLFSLQINAAIGGGHMYRVISC